MKFARRFDIFPTLAPVDIRATDEPFDNSADAGEPGCTCSRCSRPIGEGMAFLRVWPAKGNFAEWRFCTACVEQPAINYHFQK